jgi:hypothetical protein
LSYLDRSKRIQLDAAENRFATLEQEYIALSNQISYTSNQSEQVRLEKQLDELKQRMEAAEQVCDQLKQAIADRGQPAPWQGLLPWLEALPWAIVAQAYQSSLPPEARARSTPDTVIALVQQLADMPDEPGQPTSIERLAIALLSNQALTSNQRQSIADWAEAQGLAVAHPQGVHTVDYILMIKVQPRAAGDSSQGYLVSAALITDSNPRDIEAPCQATPLARGGTPVQTLADLPELLSEWMACCGSDYSIPLVELEVHWFLPLELMGWPVEHITIRTGRTQEDCHGQRCKTVVVRSYDRQFSLDYRAVRGDWHRYWQRLLDCNPTIQGFLAPLKPHENQTTINWSQSHILGCAFVEHPRLQTQIDFWDRLLSQGVPFALYVRHLGFSLATNGLVQLVIQGDPLDLPTRLTQQRSQAFARAGQAPEADRLRAAPLALLWDNPHRPFPTVDYTST